MTDDLEKQKEVSEPTPDKASPLEGLTVAIAGITSAEGTPHFEPIEGWFSQIDTQPGEVIDKQALKIDGYIYAARGLFEKDPTQAKQYLMKAREEMRFYPQLEREQAWWEAANIFDLTTDELYFLERPEAFYKALAAYNKGANLDYSNIQHAVERKLSAIPPHAVGKQKAEGERLEILMGKCMQWEGLYTLNKHLDRNASTEQKRPSIDEALQKIRASAEYFESKDQKIWQARALIDLANSYIYKSEQEKSNDFSEAVTIFDRVDRILASVTNGDQARYPAEDNKTDPLEAIKGLAKIKRSKIDMNLAQQFKDTPEKYREYMRNGMTLVQQGIDLLQPTRQEYFKANAFANRGRLRLLLANFEKLFDFTLARTLYEEAETDEQEACDAVDRQAQLDIKENLHGAGVYKGHETMLYEIERKTYANAVSSVQASRSAFELQSSQNL